MFKDLRILIIEDEQKQLNLLKRSIKQLGHQLIASTSSGQAGYQQIMTLHPDLIVLNTNLKGRLTSAELARRLSTEVNIPILLSTSTPEEITLRELQKIGVFGVLQKPFTLEDLKTEIDYTYERSQKLRSLRLENVDSKRHLQETEQFFQQLVNNVSDIIYRIDFSGAFTYLNPSAIKSTGYEKDYLYKAKYTDIIRSDYKRKAQTFFQRLIKEQVPDAYLEVPIRLKNGKEMWLGQNIHLLRIGGKVAGLQVVARDITKEIQFKEELIKARNNAEHTAELKSQFLANMSHEIRTPLNGIIGISKLLEKTPLNEKQRTYLRAVSASSDQLMGIINDILDLSKIESGKMELNKVEFNFNELVRSLIDVMEIKAGLKGLALNYQIDAELPEILVGDPVSLNQILYNLIGNSLKFTQEGGIGLKVNLRRDCNNDNCTHIEMIVSDTGVGMKKDVQDKIFEAFTQAESSTTRQFGGTGLGLTIVKKLIDLQKGSIFVESEEGRGTEFYVHLCFDKYLPEKSSNHAKVLVDDSILLHKHILVVEDNFVNQLVTKDLLEDVGSIVTIAENGLVALEKLNSSHFDLVLMDMQMPVLDGFEAMKRIRKDPINARIPILALTANVVKSEIEKCMKSGASGYLSKPFMPEDLISRIKNLLMGEQSTIRSKTIDMTILSSYTNGKELLTLSTLKELNNVFKTEMKEIQEFMEVGDLRNVRSRMHKLKPNFQMIGLNGLHDLARQAEKTEDHEELKGIVTIILNGMPDIVKQLKEEFEILERKLEEVI